MTKNELKALKLFVASILLGLILCGCCNNVDMKPYKEYKEFGYGHTVKPKEGKAMPYKNDSELNWLWTEHYCSGKTSPTENPECYGYS
jgi:hypothetical protein